MKPNIEIINAQKAFEATKEKFDSVDITEELERINLSILEAIEKGYLMTWFQQIAAGILKANKIIQHLDKLGYHCGMSIDPQFKVDENGEKIHTWSIFANWELMPQNRRESF